MAQVITPAPPGTQDQESKNWFRAQKYRQLIHQLEMMREDIDATDRERASVTIALRLLRDIFNSLVPEEQHIGVKRAMRRGCG
jgi:hypothetical protein